MFLTRSPSSALLPLLGEGSPTKIDYRKKGTLILTCLLEDLVKVSTAVQLKRMVVPGDCKVSRAKQLLLPGFPWGTTELTFAEDSQPQFSVPFRQDFVWPKATHQAEAN